MLIYLTAPFSCCPAGPTHQQWSPIVWGLAKWQFPWGVAQYDAEYAANAYPGDDMAILAGAAAGGCGGAVSEGFSLFPAVVFFFTALLYVLAVGRTNDCPYPGLAPMYGRPKNRFAGPCNDCEENACRFPVEGP